MPILHIATTELDFILPHLLNNIGHPTMTQQYNSGRADIHFVSSLKNSSDSTVCRSQHKLHYQ